MIHRYAEDFPEEEPLDLFSPGKYGVPAVLLGTAYMAVAGALQSRNHANHPINHATTQPRNHAIFDDASNDAFINTRCLNPGAIKSAACLLIQFQ